MIMHATNLYLALQLAIDAQRKNERLAGFTHESALLSGWIEARDSLLRGESVQSTVLPSGVFPTPS